MWDDLRQQGSSLIVLMSQFSRYGLAAFTLAILLSFVVGRFHKKVQIPIAILWLTICSFGISGILGDVMKEIIRRPRPAAVFMGQLVIWSDSLTSSIPSGHTTKAVAMILPFLFLIQDKSPLIKIVKALLVFLALTMGISRILLGAHFLSDVLAGIGTAFLGFPPSISFGKMVLKKIPDEQLRNMSVVWSVLLLALTGIFILL
jgi:membrane-associated phospholipid phosphatase